MEPVDLIIEDSRWESLALEALVQRAVVAALAHLGLEARLCDLSLLACDDARIAGLNAEFRDQPSPTNVLSWPAEDRAAEQAGDTPMPLEPDFDGRFELGDIAIAFDTCAREAEAAGKPMVDHVTHLTVHGLLHLLGYDHERDPDATLMEGLESEILGKLGIDDPYRDALAG